MSLNLENKDCPECKNGKLNAIKIKQIDRLAYYKCNDCQSIYDEETVYDIEKGLIYTFLLLRNKDYISSLKNSTLEKNLEVMIKLEKMKIPFYNNQYYAGKQVIDLGTENE